MHSEWDTIVELMATLKIYMPFQQMNVANDRQVVIVSDAVLFLKSLPDNSRSPIVSRVSRILLTLSSRMSPTA